MIPYTTAYVIRIQKQYNEPLMSKNFSFPNCTAAHSTFGKIHKTNFNIGYDFATISLILASNANKTVKAIAVFLSLRVSG